MLSAYKFIIDIHKIEKKNFIGDIMPPQVNMKKLFAVHYPNTNKAKCSY